MQLVEQKILEADDGIRLDRWFKRHHPGLPHALLEKNLRKGLIRLDGKKIKSSDRIMSGQALTYPDVTVAVRPGKARVASEQELAEIRKWMIYKDPHIIVINKPFGLPVQGGTKIARSVDDLLDGLKFDGDRPKLVHRLDRDTSGCLVLARSSKSATALMKLFSSRRVDKTYWALVNNLPDPLRGTIDLPILKKENPKAMGRPGGPEGRDYEIMQVDEEEGQKAISEYRVLEQLARKFALVELKPLTGRTHQLRVHMAAIGCPILGDHKYGGATDAGESIGVENVLHLHARRIVLPGTVHGKGIDVTAPLPTHMKKSFRALGIDVPKN